MLISSPGGQIARGIYSFFYLEISNNTQTFIMHKFRIIIKQYIEKTKQNNIVDLASKGPSNDNISHSTIVNWIRLNHQ